MVPRRNCKSKYKASLVGSMSCALLSVLYSSTVHQIRWGRGAANYQTGRERRLGKKRASTRTRRGKFDYGGNDTPPRTKGLAPFGRPCRFWLRADQWAQSHGPTFKTETNFACNLQGFVAKTHTPRTKGLAPFGRPCRFWLRADQWAQSHDPTFKTATNFACT